MSSQRQTMNILVILFELAFLTYCFLLNIKHEESMSQSSVGLGLL